MNNKQQACPCRSGKSYQECCQPLHNLETKPASCEALMRSRYCAFILQLGEYLFNTYHLDFRGDLTIEQLSEKSANWVNLQIVEAESLETTGFVEFKAWFIEDDKLCCFHERSNFAKDHDQWLYCDGTFYPSEKSGSIGRNEACPCASGKKFKKCCTKN